MSNKQAVIYTRVSTDEQAISGLGLEAQLATCRRHCEGKGYTVIGEYSDPAVSGRDDPFKRPGLRSLLALESIRDLVVVVYSVSRLTRRQSQMWKLLDDRGDIRLQLESCTEAFDTATPMGRAMLGMLGVWAQLEADQISARTKAALAARKARGLPIGQKSILATNPEIAARVGHMYTVEGKGYRSICRELNLSGVPAVHGGRWHPQTVRAAVLQYRANKQLETSND